MTDTAVNKGPQRVGRRRWADLTRFLTQQMKTAKSERVRMQAALRLADILELREQREHIQLRKAARLEVVQATALTAAANAGSVSGAEDAELEPVETESEKIKRFLAGLSGKGTNA